MAIAIACGALAAKLQRRADACAPAPPPGKRVTIGYEDALIVWDGERGVEHFVRRAGFATDAPDFGFLVPTPTLPELAEIHDSVLARLEELTQPPIIEREVTELQLTSLIFADRSDSTDSSDSDFGSEEVGAVEELHRQRVAGYDAVVLRADDASELANWLTKHGYPYTPTLKEWATPYVARGWVFTAFKQAPPEVYWQDFSTSAVRMTFATDRPFYPYREPSDQRDGPLPPFRKLRVFFVGEHRMEGTFEHGEHWSGITDLAIPLPAAALEDEPLTFEPDDLGTLALGNYLDTSFLPEGAWLTAFVDRSNPRPGELDLYFSEADGDEEVHPQPIEKKVVRPILVPIEPLALILGTAAFFAIRMRSRRRLRDGSGPA